MPIPAGHKFSCVGLPVVTELPPDVELRLSDTMFACVTPPHGFAEHWTTWLGTLAMEQFRECDLFIVRHKPSARLDVLDREELDLDGELDLYWRTLLLELVPRVTDHEALQVHGSVTEQEAKATGVRRLRMPVWGQWSPIPRVTRTNLERALTAFESLRRLDDQPTRYTRLKRGWRAYQAAVHEVDPLERLHQCVRALDAILKLPPTDGRKNFVGRSRVLAKGKPQVLHDIYWMRNAAEHLNDWRDVFASLDEKEANQAADTRVYQAERLAAHALRRALVEPPLLGHYEDDAAIDRLWGSTEQALKQLWAAPLDLTLVGKEMDFTFYDDIVTNR